MTPCEREITSQTCMRTRPPGPLSRYPFAKKETQLFSLAQRRPVRRRFESPGLYSDDDANSDASSACSERSYSSRNGGAAPHYMRQTEDVAEVLNHCASANWSERKEGLLGLQNLFKSQRLLRWMWQEKRKSG